LYAGMTWEDFVRRHVLFVLFSLVIHSHFQAFSQARACLLRLPRCDDIARWFVVPI
jgi:hypothetical protein